MSLKFHAVKRKVLAGPDVGRQLYFGQVRCNRPVSLEKLCQEVSDKTSVTTSDVLVVLDGFDKVVSLLLDEGHIVELGELGNLRVTAGSRGAETEEDFTRWMMKRGRVVLHPGKVLRDVCHEVSFEKIKPRYYTEDCFLPHE